VEREITVRLELQSLVLNDQKYSEASLTREAKDEHDTIVNINELVVIIKIYGLCFYLSMGCFLNLHTLEMDVHIRFF
jgi:hypothetical protein